MQTAKLYHYFAAVKMVFRRATVYDGSYGLFAIQELRSRAEIKTGFDMCGAAIVTRSVSEESRDQSFVLAYASGYHKCRSYFGSVP